MGQNDLLDIMEDILFVLILISLFLLILGLFSPKTSLFWTKSNLMRGKSSLIYGLATILFFVAFGETASIKKPDNSYYVAITNEKSNQYFEYLKTIGLHASAYNLLYESTPYEKVKWDREKLKQEFKKDAIKCCPTPLVEDNSK